MKNKFIVMTYRFHTKNENKFLVVGWFRENTIGNNELRVCLDKKNIHFSIEEKDFVGGAVKALDGLKENENSISFGSTFRKAGSLVRNFRL